jgi:hypothetical protein
MERSQKKYASNKIHKSSNICILKGRSLYQGSAEGFRITWIMPIVRIKLCAITSRAKSEEFRLKTRRRVGVASKMENNMI